MSDVLDREHLTGARPVKLLIVGATGLLGHQLLATAGRDARFEVWYSVRDAAALARVPAAARPRALLCDVTDAAQIEQAAGHGFDVIVNCAGLTKALATDPVQAIRMNALAPHLLAAAATRVDARLIHISTDCVFSGRHGHYDEADLPDPDDLYGRSKLLGEVSGDGHLTVRTSFIGPELRTRHGLLEWFLAQRGRIQGYSQVYWSGCTSQALSRILLALAVRPDVTGLLHVAGERIDKYTLLCKLQAAYDKRDVVIEPTPHPVCDRSLNNRRFQGLGLPYPGMDEMIAELAAGGPSEGSHQPSADG